MNLTAKLAAMAHKPSYNFRIKPKRDISLVINRIGFAMVAIMTLWTTLFLANR